MPSAQQRIFSNPFSAGLRAGIPIAIGYIPIAMAFGLLARSSGIPDGVTLLLSLLVFAGASQFVGIKLMALGTSPWEIVLTTFLLNFRHFLMSASLSQRFSGGHSRSQMALLAFGVTDETFALASFRPEDKLHPSFVLGVNLIAYAAWNGGTWAGLFLAAGLPETLKSSMGIALYVMFIGLLIPAARRSKEVWVIALTAMAINGSIHYLPLFQGVSPGWGIILSTLAASLLGAFLYAKKEDAHG